MQLRQGLENFRLGQPAQHANFHVSHFTIAGIYEPEEQLQALLNVSADDLQAFIKDLFSRSHVEGLVHGNVRQKDAQELVGLLESTLGIRDPLPKEERLSSRCLLPPQGSFCYRAPVQDPDQLNSAIDSLYYIGDESNPAIRIRASLLAQLAQEPCFDQLRTKEQLGYVVQSGSRNSVRFVGFHIIIQSERDAEYLDDRIEAFLVDFRKLLQDMPQAEYVQQRQSLINRKMEDQKNMGQECVPRFGRSVTLMFCIRTNSYWAHIQSQYYDYQRSKWTLQIFS
jgi:insulysin